MKVTCAYLQSLSTEELFTLADSIDLYLPQGLHRQLIIGEILSFVDEQANTIEHCLLQQHILIEEEKDVTSYGKTEIKAVIRDPIWIFVFWDIHVKECERLMHHDGFESIFLRVFSCDPKNPNNEDFFDIDVAFTDRKRYIHVSLTEVANRVDLCVRFRNKIEVLARSLPLSLNRSAIKKVLYVSENRSDTLTRLSGLASLKKAHFNTYRQAFQ